MKNKHGNAADPSPNISQADRNAIEHIIRLAHDLTGVQLTDRHQSMIASRLGKRVSELLLESLSAYLEYFHANRAEETPKLVSLLTTHHTYFFREFAHFEYLANHALPALLPSIRARSDKKLHVWAAACSRGHEVYSLAMFLDFHLKRLDPTVKFEILGTDVDPESIAIAKNGVYHRNDLKEAPLALLADHWAKGTEGIEAYVKAKKSLTQHCHFHTQNLLSPGSVPATKFDVIFCRNVFIYFNQQQICAITGELLSRLGKNGYLFIGISESLSGLGLPVGSPGPSVYQHKEAHGANAQRLKQAEDAKRPGALPKPAEPKPAAKELPQERAIAAPSAPIRVLCVDDSPSILTLLKKILSKQDGFEVVGTAMNGLEAAQKVSELKPDVLTLDIHMPEQNGIEYLEKNNKPGHPPVVMVTSVSRDNADLAGKALTLGAADYVEKPALTNLADRGEEIRNKLKCAVTATSSQLRAASKLDRSFQTRRALLKPEEKLRIVVFPLASRSKLKAFFSELSGAQPPAILLIEGARDALGAVAETLSRELGKKVAAPAEVAARLAPGDIALHDMSRDAQKIWETHGKSKMTSILVFDEVSKANAAKILMFEGAQLVLEDLGKGQGTKPLMEVASDVVLSTSFAYLSEEFFWAEDPAASAKKKAA